MRPWYVLAAKACVALLLLLLSVAPAAAHAGRRFEVGVDNGQLFAQGINSGVPDQAPEVRPYRNVIHDHWIQIGPSASIALLPGFDLRSPTSELWDASLNLTLQDVYKWIDPPLAPTSDTLPIFQRPDSETTGLRFGSTQIDVAAGLPATLTLVEQISFLGHEDLDPTYQVSLAPSDVLYVFQLGLSTSAAEIRDSDPIYAILAPVGTSMEERLHDTSLFLENYLSQNAPIIVPEPSTGALLVGLLVLSAARLPGRSARRRSTLSGAQAGESKQAQS